MALSGIGIRWTIGDVSEAGFETLRLSIIGVSSVFGDSASYAVCVNTISREIARERTGSLPVRVEWVHAAGLVPTWLRNFVGSDMAEGVAWKLCPVRLFPQQYELSFDNDLILWSIPTAMKSWLESDAPDACLLAEDVQPAAGQFAPYLGTEGLNSGIRGFAPGMDVESRLLDFLRKSGRILQSELDEQGLQAAVLSRRTLFRVGIDDVSICSAFPMHHQALGHCGVHFVGINAKTMPWILNGRPGHHATRENWLRWRPQVVQRISQIQQ
jgi:hypothetical protein